MSTDWHEAFEDVFDKLIGANHELDRLRARVEELEMEIALCSGGCTLTCSHAKAATEREGK